MHNAEQEEAALIGMAVQGVSIPGAWSSLRAEHFVGPVAPVKVGGGVVPPRAHARVWRLLDEARTGDRLEPSQVIGLLLDAGVEVVGPPAYWMGLPSHELDTEPLCSRVLEAASRRQLLTVLDTVGKAARSPSMTLSETLNLMDDLRKTVDAVQAPGSDWVDAFQAQDVAMADILHRMEVHRSGGKAGLTTGLGPLDELLGPLEPDPILLLGRPAMGKTTIALKIARAILEQGGRVSVFSMEMDARQLTQRLISDLTGIPGDAFRKGDLTRHQYSRACEAAEVIGGWDFNLNPRPALRIEEMRAEMREATRRYGTPDLWVIDHVHLMRWDPKLGEVAGLAAISAGIKAATKEHGCPALALAQLNREVERRSGDPMPKMADIRGSGAWEQDATAILGIHRPGALTDCPPERRDLVQIGILKNRYGKTGVVDLRWDNDRGGLV